MAVAIDRPQLAVGVRPRESVALGKPGPLTGEGQHTAGSVARMQPVRAPSSKASGAVEQHEQACRFGRGKVLLHRPSSTRSVAPSELAHPTGGVLPLNRLARSRPYGDA